MLGFFSAPALYSERGKIYKGILILYNDRIVICDNYRILFQHHYNICESSISCGKKDVVFFNLYKKEKSYIRIEDNNSFLKEYYLDQNDIDILLLVFEKRKEEEKGKRIASKAKDLGYTGREEGISNTSQRSGCYIKRPEDINQWEDMLPPREWRDYYWSLSYRYQIIYDTILKGIIEYKDIVYLDEYKLNKTTIGSIYHYILWDNPAIFCIGEYAMWDSVVGEHGIKITSLCGDKKTEQSLRKQVVAEVKKILSKPGLYEYGDVEKELYVHDYLVRNIPYDLSKGNNGARLEPYTVYGALVQRTCVCEGFSKTAKLLLDLLGVHTLAVSGQIKKANEGHAWNVVRIDNKAYHLDITHDIALTGGRNRPIRHDYFNVADIDLQDRIWNDPDVVWRCNSRDRNYTTCVGGLIESEEQFKTYVKDCIKRKKHVVYIRFSPKVFSIDNTTKAISWLKSKYTSIANQNKIHLKAIIGETDLKGLFIIMIKYE